MTFKSIAVAVRLLFALAIFAFAHAAHAQCAYTPGPGASEVFTCSGNSDAFTVIGSGADTTFRFLEGTTGTVTLVSGGATTLDVVDFSSWAGPVTVSLMIQGTPQQVAPGLFINFQGFTRVQLLGGAGNDTLAGTTGSDIIDGGGGVDTQPEINRASCDTDVVTNVETDACDYSAVRSYTAPSATGSGSITASFTGGGGTCTFGVAQFIPVSGHAASPSVAPPAGVLFTHGLFDFTTSACTPASTITMTVTYPATLHPATNYWKFGPTPTDATPHWYTLPVTIAGNVATFTIADGGLGDDDLTANGTIVDQGGPGFSTVAAAGVPTLSQWLLMLMALAMIGMAVREWRRDDRLPSVR